MHLPQLAPESPADTLAAELSRILRGQVRFSFHDRALYSTDASLYQQQPIGVIVPADIEDLITAVRYLAAHDIPILPRGGGTSLAGQCTNRAVVIDTSPALRRLLSVDPANKTCRAQPGLPLDDLNRQLKPHNLFFAPDPATSAQATLGGCIGNNAAGARSIKYGRTSESIRSLDVLLTTGHRLTLGPQPPPPEGEVGGTPPGEGSPRPPYQPSTINYQLHSPSQLATPKSQLLLSSQVAAVVRRYAPQIRERFPKTIRRNAGYALDAILAQLDAGTPDDALNLAPLICGSEGTLAIVLSAELELHPIPAARPLVIASFPSLEQAIDAVLPALATQPSAIELLDDVVLACAAENTEYRRYLELFKIPTTLPPHGAQPPPPEGEAGGTPPGEGSPTPPPHPTPPPSQLATTDSQPPHPNAQLPQALLYIEYETPTPHQDFAPILEALKKALPTATLKPYLDPPSLAQAWALRKAAEPLLHALPGSRKPHTFVEDNAVPPENLAQFVREFKRIVASHNTTAAFYAHASVGLLHVRPLIDLHDPADLDRMRAIAVEVADLARACGGVMSGEHGDGKVRGPLLERFYGPELMQAFREIKSIFDPQGLLNPGNITNPGPIESITQGLRIQQFSPSSHQSDAPPTNATPPRGLAASAASALHETSFTFTQEGNFAHALEACNGAGVCRRTSVGAMCPSYRATLDERHSPRGRANALRTSLLSTSPPNFTDPETTKTLDLCLSCKACKTECPSNVDISKLKAEYTAQRYKTHRPPLSAYAIAHVRTLNRLATLLPRLSNALAKVPPLAALTKKLLNLAPQRPLPHFAKPAKHIPAPPQHDQPTVRLFADCFNTYNTPNTAKAAIQLLEAFGYQVDLINPGCCARPALSTGLLPTAITQANHTLKSLLKPTPPKGAPPPPPEGEVGGTPPGEGSHRPPYQPSTINDQLHSPPTQLATPNSQLPPTLFLEPSCASAIRDDYLDLNLAAPIDQRQQLAARSYLVDEFLDKRWSSHPRIPTFTSPTEKVLLHIHCHQRALWTESSSTHLLKRLGIPHTLTTPTCCGLAGAFGYARNHYDLSIQIANLTLVPEAQAHLATNPHATLCAPGTSCRDQLHHTTGQTPQHPVELLASLLVPTAEPM